MKTLFTTMTMMIAIGSGFAAAEKPAPPTAENLEPLLEGVRKDYQSEFRQARKPESQFVLAGKLLDDAGELQDANQQYAMLLTAKELYQQSGFHDRAFRVIDQVAERFDVDVADVLTLKRETLEDAAKSRTLNPLSVYMLAIETRKIIVELLAVNDDFTAREISGLMEEVAKKVGNRGLAEKFEDLDAAIKELESLEKVEGQQVELGQVKSMLAEDRHLAHAGAMHLDNAYFLKMQIPQKADEMRIRFNGQTGSKGTSEGKISVTFDGENWTEVSGWDTTSCRKAAGLGNWHEFTLSGPELLTIDRLGVKFEYIKGSDRLEVFRVAIVR